MKMIMYTEKDNQRTEMNQQIGFRPIQKNILTQVRRGCRSESEVVMWVRASMATPCYSAKFIVSEIQALIDLGQIERVPGWGLQCK